MALKGKFEMCFMRIGTSQMYIYGVGRGLKRKLLKIEY